MNPSSFGHYQDVSLEEGRLTLVTQRPLPGAPLEALDDAVLHRAEQRLVHLHGTGMGAVHVKKKKRSFWIF